MTVQFKFRDTSAAPTRPYFWAASCCDALAESKYRYNYYKVSYFLAIFAVN